jgi:hypothetical protein
LWQIFDDACETVWWRLECLSSIGKEFYKRKKTRRKMLKRQRIAKKSETVPVFVFFKSRLFGKFIKRFCIGFFDLTTFLKTKNTKEVKSEQDSQRKREANLHIFFDFLQIVSSAG